MNTIKEIELLLLKAGNGEKIDSISPAIQSHLRRYIEQDRLQTQLSLVCDMIKTGGMKIKKVTNVRTIAEAMNKSTIYKGMLGEVDKLLKLYFTLISCNHCNCQEVIFLSQKDK